jgi:Uncharacterized protein conserved in bacteria (DUF2066)
VRTILAVFAILITPILTAHADSPFTVSNVRIDASASNALEAQRAAMGEGQVEAARRLITRLTLPEDRAALGAISSDDANSMIAGLRVVNEQRSATRYLGDLEVNFDPQSVRRYLSSAGVPFVEAQALDAVVLPVLLTDGASVLWDGNPWLSAWRELDFSHALTPTRAPEGSSARAFITAQSAAGFDQAALQETAAAYGVSRIVVAVARASGGSVRYEGAVYTFSSDGLERRDPIAMRAISGGYSTAAERLVADLEMAWKRESVVRGGGTREARVTVVYRNLAEWRRLQQAVASASLVSDARLDALSRDGALMTLSYRGERSQLEREFSARGAVLVDDPDIGLIIRSR